MQPLLPHMTLGILLAIATSVGGLTQTPTRISCTSDMLIPITTCKQFAAGSDCPLTCKTCPAVAGTSLPAGCYTANTVASCMDPADGAIYAGDGACPKALPSVAPETAVPTALPGLNASRQLPPTLASWHT